MLVEKQASCKFCGKQKFLNVVPEMSQSEVDELATQTCDCDLAKARRGLKITEEAIQALLGAASIEKGFDYEVDEDTISAIRKVCECVLNGLMDKVSLEEPNGDTIKLVRNGYTVKVQRTCKKQITM